MLSYLVIHLNKRASSLGVLYRAATEKAFLLILKFLKELHQTQTVGTRLAPDG